MNKKSSYEQSFIKFIPYLEDIDIVTKTMIDRIEYIYTLCKEMTTEEIDDIFVEDYINKDGTREYEIVNFFSTSHIISANNFLTKVDIIVAPLFKRIINWSIQAQDFNFKKATIKSRLHLDARIYADELGVTFKATGDNCRYLQTIISKYIKPNLISP